MLNIKANKRKVRQFILGTAIMCGLSTAKNYAANVEEITVLPNTVRPSIEQGTIVSDGEVTIFDMGNHKYTNLENLESEMRYCEKKNIPVGIIISSTAKDLCDINNDVQYVKQIFIEHKIDNAVYLNVNDIVANSDIDDETKAKIVRDFLVNCSENNIYVGLYGSDSNLCHLKDMSEGIFDINKFDAFVVMDGPKILYTGPYNTYKDYNGNVYSSVDISELVKENGLNNPDNFINDAGYVIGEEDTKEKIEELFDMPIEDIIKYSGISIGHLRPGVTLRIPRNKMVTEVETNSKTVSDNEHANASGYFIGVDVSSYQEKIDWDKLTSSVDFVIAKSNEGAEFVDYMFDIYAEGCEKNGIALGAYCFNGYWGALPYDEFVARQREQVSVTIATLRGKKVEAPVYFDIEGQLNESLLPPNYVEAMLNIWYTEITKAGYKPGIYSGQFDMNYLYDCAGSELFDKFDLWVAGGYDYNTELDTHEIKPSYNELDFLYSNLCEKVNVVQVTQYGYDAGASNNSGYVDLNFSKKSFNGSEKKVVQNLVPGNFNIKRFHTSTKATNKATGVAVLGGVVLGAGLVADDRRKKTKKLIYVKENSGF